MTRVFSLKGVNSFFQGTFCGGARKISCVRSLPEEEKAKDFVTRLDPIFRAEKLTASLKAFLILKKSLCTERLLEKQACFFQLNEINAGYKKDEVELQREIEEATSKCTDYEDRRHNHEVSIENLRKIEAVFSNETHIENDTGIIAMYTGYIVATQNALNGAKKILKMLQALKESNQREMEEIQKTITQLEAECVKLDPWMEEVEESIIKEYGNKPFFLVKTFSCP